MSTERPLIRVKPSWLHQQILLLGHLLLLLLLWNWLHGLYWNWFLVGTLLSLGYALYQARLRRFTLGWQREEISYQGSRYQLGPHSRVGYGFLWLQLLDEKQSHTLWLFSDGLSPDDYRYLARLITTRQ